MTTPLSMDIRERAMAWRGRDGARGCGGFERGALQRGEVVAASACDGECGSGQDRRACAAQVSIIGLDLAKRVFQVHGATADGRVAFRKKLSRAQVLVFFAPLPPCVVAMEACATAHYWAREIGALGHDVRLVPPAYVKPFVK